MSVQSNQIREPEQEPTRRPWAWRDFGSGLCLVSATSGIPIVMDFGRKGMHGAEPRFGKRTDNMGGIMVPLSEWEELPPDAEFIIRAVNNHDALIAEVEELRRMLMQFAPLVFKREVTPHLPGNLADEVKAWLKGTRTETVLSAAQEQPNV